MTQSCGRPPVCFRVISRFSGTYAPSTMRKSRSAPEPAPEALCGKPRFHEPRGQSHSCRTRQVSSAAANRLRVLEAGSWTWSRSARRTTRPPAAPMRHRLLAPIHPRSIDIPQSNSHFHRVSLSLHCASGSLLSRPDCTRRACSRFDNRQAGNYSGFAAFAAAQSEPGLKRLGFNVSMLS